MQVSDDDNTVMIEFTPTIPHCSMATLIGLSIRVKLLRALPSRFKVRFLFLYIMYIALGLPFYLSLLVENFVVCV